MGLEIFSREKQGIVILSAKGNIDISASEFIETVGWHLSNHRLDILCDFEQVDMLDYAGLSVLTIAYKNVANHDGRMKFVNVPSCVMNVLKAVMLDRIFEIYDSEEVALNAFKEDREIQRIKHLHLRRRYKRLYLDIPVRYKCKLNSQDEFSGKIFDLSGEGIFIFGKKTFCRNEKLALEFELPRIGTISIDAKVVWLADKDVQPQLYPGMGLEFCGIPINTQKAIVNFIEKNADYRTAPNLPPL